MFRGFSSVSLDSKGRLAVPSRYRERLVGGADGALVQTLNPLDRSLWLYPLPEWEIIEAKLADLSDFDTQSRRAKQMMRGYATDCQLDTHGRILIPAELRDYAQIDKQAVILGQGNKFEIWNRTSWQTQREHWLQQLGDEQGAPAAALQSLSL
ncbi:MAG: division/cell wall cluster transcriptional repressor MraZ [Gammaproteobacteria bacterium]|nr:division/cell wall cluster transcriptional repressor MraZ [Gammaproteobacteria bacterium]MCY4211302.1 division/cell wall cluster transcriptional repressor MraZ [Gammaproteobacteria bacterium]MCY4283506.1 division/cell wall cluster transcriptional repressor MraZ [Gammaproteobacteria bacterium]MCY4337247.1 division/cell wall cluster transcriptional repressor MraZ [Gammaproteobacteria bacterium]